jgi:hypothetical protein
VTHSEHGAGVKTTNKCSRFVSVIRCFLSVLTYNDEESIAQAHSRPQRQVTLSSAREELGAVAGSRGKDVANVTAELRGRGAHAGVPMKELQDGPMEPSELLDIPPGDSARLPGQRFFVVL